MTSAGSTGADSTMKLAAAAMPFAKQCPLCGTAARAFVRDPKDEDSKHRLRNLKLPGEELGRNEYCPNCGCNSRERLLYLYLLHYTDVFTPTAPRLRVLARGEVQRLAERVGKVSRVELAQDQMDGLFDIVLEDRVLERADDDRHTLNLLRDQLIPGGRLIVSEPVSPVLPATLEDESIITERQRKRAFGSRKRKRVFGADLEMRIREASLNPQTFDWRNDRNRFGGFQNRFALARGQTLMICRR